MTELALRALVVEHLAALQSWHAGSPDAYRTLRSTEDALRIEVGEDVLSSAIRAARSGDVTDPEWQAKVWAQIDRPWWHSTRCLVLVGCAVLLVFAIVAAIGLRLRATDAEVQLGTCQRESRCLKDPAVCR